MDILVRLISSRDWVTGDELALSLGVSKKTVQQEIRRIEEELGDGCRIRSSQKKGYRLEQLSDSLRQKLISDLEISENHYNMRGRTSVLALYLLFQRDYVTMDRLAEVFFLSKSTVFSEVKIMKRWMGRQGGISLEVSGTKGVRVRGNELDRRFRCAAFCMPGIVRQLPGQKEEWERYEAELSVIRRGLGEELAGKQVRISGEDFGKACRYLAVSLLRDRLGFPMEENGGEERLEHWGLFFTRQEFEGLDRLMDTASAFSGGEPVHDGEILPEAERRLKQLEEELSARLPRTEKRELFPERDQLLLHLTRMERRLASGRYATNYYDKDLIITYPLETHLMEVCCRAVLGRDLPKAELFFLTAYLAGGLDGEKDRTDVLLVSDQSPGLTANLETFVRRHLGCEAGNFRTEPVYLFEAGAERERAGRKLLLTTEREISILHPEFLLFPAVVRGAEEESAAARLEKWREERKKERVAEALKRFQKAGGKPEQGPGRKPEQGPGRRPGQEPGGSSDGLEEFLAAAGWERRGEISANSLPGGLLWLCRSGSGNEPSIRLIELEKPMEYNRRTIRRLLAADWSGRGEEMFDFFLGVSFLLEENSRKEGKSLPF